MMKVTCGWEESERGGSPQPHTPREQCPAEPRSPAALLGPAVLCRWYKREESRGKAGERQGTQCLAAGPLPGGLLKLLQIPSCSHLYLMAWIHHLHLRARKRHEHRLCPIHAHHLRCPFPPHLCQAEKNGRAGGALTHQ